MSSFFISRRKFFELLALIIIDLVFYFLWDNLDFVILFSFGYVWNWVASQESDVTLGNTKRYRFSTIKTVFNLQNLIVKPFPHLPSMVKTGLKSLPAGMFWTAVIWFNNSQMPWWAVFLGSLSAELAQLESKFFKPKDLTP